MEFVELIEFVELESCIEFLVVDCDMPFDMVLSLRCRGRFKYALQCFPYNSG